MHIHFGWVSLRNPYLDGGRYWSKIQNFQRKIYKAHVSKKKQGMCVKDKDSTMISNQEVLAGCLSFLDCVCRGWTWRICLILL